MHDQSVSINTNEVCSKPFRFDDIWFSIISQLEVWVAFISLLYFDLNFSWLSNNPNVQGFKIQYSWSVLGSSGEFLNWNLVLLLSKKMQWCPLETIRSKHIICVYDYYCMHIADIPLQCWVWWAPQHETALHPSARPGWKREHNEDFLSRKPRTTTTFGMIHNNARHNTPFSRYKRSSETICSR